MTVYETKYAEMIALKVAPEVASVIARQFEAEHMRIVSEERRKAEEAIAKADAASGVKNWHGIRISGCKGERPSEKYSKALESGVAIEPANRGVDSQTGAPVLWPPMAWICVEGRTLLKLTQAQCVTLVKAMEGPGAENFLQMIRQVGSTEAVKAYETEKAALVASGEIVGRKTK